MEAKIITLEKIQSTLEALRQDPHGKPRIPRALWASIIQQTKIHPLKEVCRRLQISPAYLKRKIKSSQESALEFHEVVMSAAQLTSDIVTIELRAADGLQAKIQGPLSSLNCLTQLFRG